MTQKIVEVIKKMIEQKDSINKIERNKNEFYFIFMNYYWSILRDKDNDVRIYHYPRYNGSLITLKDEAFYSDTNIDYVAFSLKSISDERRIDFVEKSNILYEIIRDKYYNLEDTFNDILNK